MTVPWDPLIPGDWLKLNRVLANLWGILNAETTLSNMVADDTAASSNIAWMESDIDTNTSDIATLDTELTVSTSDLQAELDAVSDLVVADQSNIAWMESDLDTNTSDIVVLKSDVLVNTSDMVIAPGNDSEVVYNNGGIFGADSTFTFNDTSKLVTMQDANITGFLDFTEISEPATPAANVLRLYTEDVQGYSFFKYIDSGGMKREVLRDSMILVYNNSGSQILANRAVYATGSFNNFPTIGLARANATATMPAIGVTIENINDTSYGRVMQVGLLENIDTSALSVGDILYVHDTIAGLVRITPPVTPALTQEIGTVLVDNASTGAIQIIARGLTGDEYGTIQNDFYIGDGLSSVKTLHFNAVTDATIAWDDSTNNLTFQPAADSTTFFQVLDADGGDPILNVDSTNEIVGIGTATPSTDGTLHVRKDQSGAFTRILLENREVGAASGTNLRFQGAAGATMAGNYFDNNLNSYTIRSENAASTLILGAAGSDYLTLNASGTWTPGTAGGLLGFHIERDYAGFTRIVIANSDTGDASNGTNLRFLGAADAIMAQNVFDNNLNTYNIRAENASSKLQLRAADAIDFMSGGANTRLTLNSDGTWTPAAALDGFIISRNWGGFTRMIISNTDATAGDGTNLRFVGPAGATMAGNWFENNENVYRIRAQNAGSALYLGTVSTDYWKMNSTGVVDLETTKNAITGSSVDVSELNYRLRNPADDTGEGLGIGFAISSGATNVGAAIIFERSDTYSRGHLHFATKNTQVTGGDLAIDMTLTADGDLGLHTTTPDTTLQVVGSAGFGDDAGNEVLIEADGDVDFKGGAGLVFGSFYGNDIAFVTAGGTGTFSIITDADITASQTHNTTFQNNQELDIGAYAGMYLVEWSMSVKGTGAGKHIVGAIGVDVGGVTGDVAQSAGRNHAVTLGSSEMSLAGSTHLDLSANDEVSLMVTNETDNTNVTVEHVNLAINQVGGT